MKKIISVLLAMIVIVCSLQIFITASPEDTNAAIVPENCTKSLNDQYYAASLGMDMTTYYTFKSAVETNVKKLDLSVDIEKYGFSGQDMNTVGQIVYSIASGCPLGFYIIPHVSFSGWQYADGTIVLTAVNLESAYDEDTVRSAIAQCDSVAESMIADLYPLSDVAKALLVHDRIITMCEYDTAATPSFESSTIYGAFITKRCTCIGYSQAYQYLLTKLGIDCYVCDSKLLNHEWNIVTINGNEYHVDVTWDDPLYDITGRVLHDHFLLSTSALIASGHVKDNQIDYYSSPASTTYDNYFWKKSDTSFQTIGGSIYYIDNTAEELRRWNGGTSTTLTKSINSVWWSGENARWTANFSRLGADEDFLYYSLADSVYRYDTVRNTATQLYTVTKANFSIYGFKAEDGNFIIDLSPYATGPNFGPVTKATYGVTYKYPSGKIILGDADGDGQITSHDRMMIARYIAGWSGVEIDLTCADITCNSKVTSKDRMILSRYLDSWEGYAAYFA